MQLTHLVNLYKRCIGSPSGRSRISRCTENGAVPVEPAQARAWVEQIAASLVARGVDRGDRIAVWSESRVETLILEFSAALVGAAVVPMDPAWPGEESARVLEDADPSLIFVSARTLSSRNHGRIGFKSGSVVLLEDSIKVPLPSCACTWTELLTTGHDVQKLTARIVRQRAEASKLDDLALIDYHFDGSGTPLGVMLSHANLAVGITNAIQTFKLGKKETILVDRPWADLAQRILVFSVILSGGNVTFLPGGPVDENVARQMAQPTVALENSRNVERGVAFFAESYATSRVRRIYLAQGRRVASRRLQLLKTGNRLSLRHQFSYWLSHQAVFRRLREHFGGRLRIVIIDPAPVDRSALVLLTAAGVSVYSALGWPETTWLVAASKPLDTPPDTWTHIPQGIEFRTPYDGSLHVRGSNVTSGYWHRPEATKAVIEHRWFSTGTSGWLYDDGVLRMAGAEPDEESQARIVA